MKTLPQTLGVLSGLIVAIAALSLITMFLWNWLMPEIFGLGKIDYLQSVGLMALSNLLLPGSRSPFTKGKTKES